MKKLFPFLSLMACAFGMLNCVNRDEGFSSNVENKGLQSTVSFRGDSLITENPIVDPDPPVRDGDNWRSVPK
ncbi:hypothetical protein PQ459_13865 [Chryseobacterium sp. KACC 21268]|nr:hypothetical protein PQ459_13865 [Chryseobacterium sp. KACC 21268]